MFAATAFFFFGAGACHMARVSCHVRSRANNKLKDWNRFIYVYIYIYARRERRLAASCVRSLSLSLSSSPKRSLFAIVRSRMSALMTLLLVGVKRVLIYTLLL